MLARVPGRLIFWCCSRRCPGWWPVLAWASADTGSTLAPHTIATKDVRTELAEALKRAASAAGLLLGSLRNLTVWQQRQQLRSDLPMTLSHSSGSLLLPYTGMKFFSRALCGFHAFVHFVSVVVKRTGTVRQFSGPLRGFSDSASDPLFCHGDMLQCPADARLFDAFLRIREETPSMSSQTISGRVGLVVRPVSTSSILANVLAVSLLAPHDQP